MDGHKIGHKASKFNHSKDYTKDHDYWYHCDWKRKDILKKEIDVLEEE